MAALIFASKKLFCSGGISESDRKDVLRKHVINSIAFLLVSTYPFICSLQMFGIEYKEAGLVNAFAGLFLFSGFIIPTIALLDPGVFKFICCYCCRKYRGEKFEPKN
jgi:hypothetical protein